MQALPAGAMLAVRCSVDVVLPYLKTAAADDVLDLASINAPRSVVVAGGFREIDDLAARLTADGIASRKLATSHAFHSRMMEPMLAGFGKELAATRFSKPQLPWISTLTGTWIDPGSSDDAGVLARTTAVTPCSLPGPLSKQTHIAMPLPGR